MDDRFWINYIVRSLKIFDCCSELAWELATKIHDHMQETYEPEDVVTPGAPDTLNILKDFGYRLGLLSNRNEPCHEYLQELGLDGFFELILVAGEVSSWKPEPGLFINALARMEIGPDEAVYVGDNYYADVVGARRADIQPVLYDPNRVFPEADCIVIESIKELQALNQS